MTSVFSIQPSHHTRFNFYHLIQHDCDVNCCCDIDCNDGILQAFKCDDEVTIHEYFHSEGLERCDGDSGLLCIIADNLGKPDYYVRNEITRDQLNGYNFLIKLTAEGSTCRKPPHSSMAEAINWRP